MWRFADTRSYRGLPGWDGVTHVITLRRDDESFQVLEIGSEGPSTVL